MHSLSSTAQEFLPQPETFALSSKGAPNRASNRWFRCVAQADPRLYQIAVLSGLLLYGLGALDFEIGWIQVAVTLSVAVGTQWLCSKVWRERAFDSRSAMISGLSLCLLLRTNSLLLVTGTAALAVGSKFLFRWRGKHLFNPTNIGLVAAIWATGGRAWVSPGQWGNVAFFGFLMACLGGLVIVRAARADVTLAFLVVYLGLVFGRTIWLGEPLTIPLHRLQSGSLLLFAFFMISDPKTTPDSALGRVIFSALAAYGGWYIQFRLFRTNGLLWSLAGTALFTPALDWIFPGPRYRWTSGGAGGGKSATTYPRLSSAGPSLASALLSQPMKTILLTVSVLALALSRAEAFCGFYVAKADAKLFNKSSQVVLVRDGDRTVMTMANDYRGSLDEFAVVIPSPTTLQRGQIHVGDKSVIEHLDAYSAPRLVEYYDSDPCMRPVPMAMGAASAATDTARMGGRKDERAAALGVTIEAKYTVGEYDILILSAEQSNGLETWLKENGYKIPEGAGGVLASYIKQKMHFFVAKVNLAEQSKLGFSYLRPLQIAYESPKFMLPIRLGTVNADGPQDLIVYALTRKGRVETTNYRNVKVPSGMDIPVYVKEEFADFYRAMFEQQVKKEDMHCVFTEYAWDMGWCDPCAADPLSADELKKLGVFWQTQGGSGRRGVFGGGGGADAYITRLHVRYDRAHFPEDLVFQETGDRENFQGRYVLRHPWQGEAKCDQAKEYLDGLPKRYGQEAETLASLTGWDVAKIREKMHLGDPKETGGGKWWEKLWK